jgi:hypothetical protein
VRFHSLVAAESNRIESNGMELRLRLLAYPCCSVANSIWTTRLAAAGLSGAVGEARCAGGEGGEAPAAIGRGEEETKTMPFAAAEEPGGEKLPPVRLPCPCPSRARFVPARGEPCGRAPARAGSFYRWGRGAPAARRPAARARRADGRTDDGHSLRSASAHGVVSNFFNCPPCPFRYVQPPRVHARHA